MGLDMYLSKRTYLGANYKHNNVNGIIQLTKGEDNKPVSIQLKRVSYIEETVGYWRKANHIHQWFVENVQDGKDDCADYDVSEEQLNELLAACKTVMTNKELAAETLPTVSGFFFGGVEYDDYYFQNCQSTVEIIEALLKEDNSHADFEYRSSW